VTVSIIEEAKALLRSPFTIAPGPEAEAAILIIEGLLAGMTGLVWTKEAPTEHGWYWLRRRGDKDAEVVQVSKWMDGSVMFSFVGTDEDVAVEKLVDFYPWEIAGPIQPPE